MKRVWVPGVIAVAALIALVLGSIGSFGAHETFSFVYRSLRIVFLFFAH